MDLKNGFSVIIPVYYRDNPPWFKEALTSIYEKQTLRPSEIVLVKDGPVPKEIDKIISEFSKLYPLKIVQLPQNRGLANALNEGLKYCSYELVARMDADDVSLPNRFELQLEAFKKNPDVAVVGGYIEEFDEEMKTSHGIRRVPLDNESIKKFAKKRSPFNHMTVMFKKSIVLKEGGYPSILYFEDYALWAKLLMKSYKCINISRILVNVRAGSFMIKKRKGLKYIKNEIKLFKYFMEIGFYSYKDIIIWGLPRLMLRLFPDILLKQFYYRYLRI